MVLLAVHSHIAAAYALVAGMLVNIPYGLFNEGLGIVCGDN